MKIVKLKANSTYEFYELYVNLVLKPLYKLGSTEVLILARLYDDFDKELTNGVPEEAAIRLISSTESRKSMQSKIKVVARRLAGKETELTNVIFSKKLKSLREKNLLTKDNAPNRAQMISSMTDGFGFKIYITGEDNEQEGKSE